jgi:hypothetical protein
MLSIERRVVRPSNRVGMYGTILKSGRAKRAVPNCLLRVVFSCSSVRIKFSCSVMLALGRTVWEQEAELEGEGHTFLI